MRPETLESEHPYTSMTNTSQKSIMNPIDLWTHGGFTATQITLATQKSRTVDAHRTDFITHNDAPVYWQSKASSVAFATPHIGEAHADISSGAVEIFAAGNATTVSYTHLTLPTILLV